MKTGGHQMVSVWLIQATQKAWRICFAAGRNWGSTHSTSRCGYGKVCQLFPFGKIGLWRIGAEPRAWSVASSSSTHTSSFFSSWPRLSPRTCGSSEGHGGAYLCSRAPAHWYILSSSFPTCQLPIHPLHTHHRRLPQLLPGPPAAL